MHILVVNDDGPPSNQSSPYVQSLVATLQSAGHIVSVVLPHIQRSWIAKAHIVGHTLTPTYFRPGTLHEDDGFTSPRPFNDGKEEWVLIDGTPASCVQIGLYHVFNDRPPVDLVLSGPNYGRNTTAIFALSSGTIGGALEGAVCGKKSIALSFAFNSREHVPEIIAATSQMSLRLIEKLVREWPDDVHLYSINVPLSQEFESTKIMYTDMLQNQWTSGSSFEEVPADEGDEEIDVGKQEMEVREAEELALNAPHEANGDPDGLVSKREHRKFKWSPNFADVRESVEKSGKGDGWTVVQGMISVTPLVANFWHLKNYKGEIKLGPEAVRKVPPSKPPESRLFALIDYPYVQPLILRALASQLVHLPYQLISSITHLPSSSLSLLQFSAYEAIDFDHALKAPATTLISSYIIRKALIRKHYLSNTIMTWLVKHPESLLKHHFKAATHFELDFAEFLDEALVDAWDLNESLARNNEIGKNAGIKEWWILKPGMSDQGNGIRLFSSFVELREIFEQWEIDAEMEHDHAESTQQEDGVPKSYLLDRKETEPGSGTMTSQLRHFIAQPYIHPPLLLASRGSRKFHVRVYALAVGALKVYVYREMLALFAAKPYFAPEGQLNEENMDLAGHLTNTCFQDESTRISSVSRFWALEDEAGPGLDWKRRIYEQICGVTGEVFEAAAREQMVHFQTLPNAFEIFGVDFLVDSHLQVWLLELNAYPDFKQTGHELQDVVVGGLFEEVIRTAVAPFFGMKVSDQGSERMRLVRNVDLGRR